MPHLITFRPHPDHAAFMQRDDCQSWVMELSGALIRASVGSANEDKQVPGTYFVDDDHLRWAKMLGMWVPMPQSIRQADVWEYWIEERDGWCVIGINGIGLAAIAGRGGSVGQAPAGLDKMTVKLDEASGVEVLADVPTLTRLSIAGRKTLTDLSPLSALTNLNWLDISGCKALVDLTPLAGLQALTWLELSSCRRVSDLTPLAGLHKLLHLDLGFIGNQLTDLRPLAKLKALEFLNLDSCRFVTDLTPLAGLEHLYHLTINGFTLTDLSPLRALKQLHHLDLSGAVALSDLRPLLDLTQLHHLSLTHCEALEDLSPLAGLSELRELCLWGCSKITDLRPLANLRKLESLELHDCWRIPPEQRQAVEDRDFDALRELLKFAVA